MKPARIQNRNLVYALLAVLAFNVSGLDSQLLPIQSADFASSGIDLLTDECKVKSVGPARVYKTEASSGESTKTIEFVAKLVTKDCDVAIDLLSDKKTQQKVVELKLEAKNCSTAKCTDSYTFKGDEVQNLSNSISSVLDKMIEKNAKKMIEATENERLAKAENAEKREKEFADKKREQKLKEKFEELVASCAIKGYETSSSKSSDDDFIDELGLETDLFEGRYWKAFEKSKGRRVSRLSGRDKANCQIDRLQSGDVDLDEKEVANIFSKDIAPEIDNLLKGDASQIAEAKELLGQTRGIGEYSPSVYEQIRALNSVASIQQVISPAFSNYLRAQESLAKNPNNAYAKINETTAKTQLQGLLANAKNQLTGVTQRIQPYAAQDSSRYGAAADIYSNWQQALEQSLNASLGGTLNSKLGSTTLPTDLNAQNRFGRGQANSNELMQKIMGTELSRPTAPVEMIPVTPSVTTRSTN